jgi:hypothetical protein
MGVHILIGHEQGERTTGLDNEKAVLFDSVTGWAFGPLFREDETDGTTAEEMAELFLKWLRDNNEPDARRLTQGELEERYALWLASLREHAATTD